jgi:DNA repair exonuclease SbcCD ATPase subunit
MAISVSELAAAVRQRRSELDQQAGAAAEVARQRQEAEARCAELERAIEVEDQAVRLLTSIGEERQESARHQVEELATRAMQVIFGEELSFHLVAGERGGQATLEFMVRSRYPCGECGGNPASYPRPGCPMCEQTGYRPVVTPVLGARGGGLAAVLGFVLRLVVLTLTPGVRRLLVLDESFAHVSAGYEDRVAEFLREVAHQMGVQVILVTHSPVYASYADKRYRFAMKDGVTQVHEGESE